LNDRVKDTKPELSVKKELDSIKRLLVLLLLKIGATQEEVGAAIGLNQSNISRMFPEINIKKIAKTRKEAAKDRCPQTRN
jgi:DNA-directed RNA polymerase specialized sigma subunit